MLVGYNTNISYKEKIYHVQTEDSGQNNPVVVTLLYSKGAILASKKTNYAHILNDVDFTEKVTKLMKAQHKLIIRDLLSGKFTGDVKGEEVAGVEDSEVDEANGAEDICTSEAIIKLEAKPAAETLNTMAANLTSEQSEAKDQITKSLDDILLNYIMKRANK
jgi:hypothetical protein